MRISDWSSDVCSSDLNRHRRQGMKKFLTVAAIGALVAVAGCSDKGENAGGTVKREAGKWKTDDKLVKFEVPGLSPEMKTQTTQQMEGATGIHLVRSEERRGRTRWDQKLITQESR